MDRIAIRQKDVAGYLMEKYGIGADMAELRPLARKISNNVVLYGVADLDAWAKKKISGAHKPPRVVPTHIEAIVGRLARCDQDGKNEIPLDDFSVSFFAHGFERQDDAEAFSDWLRELIARSIPGGRTRELGRGVSAPMIVHIETDGKH